MLLKQEPSLVFKNLYLRTLLMLVVILMPLASTKIYCQSYKPRSQGFFIAEAMGLTFMPYAKFIDPKFLV